jgi:hypothetical protein
LDLNAQSKIDKGSAKHGEQIGVKVFGNADVNGFASSANMETSSSQHASKKQQTKRIPDQVPPDTPLLNSSPLTYSLTYAGVSTLELQNYIDTSMLIVRIIALRLLIGGREKVMACTGCNGMALTF